MEPDPSPLLRLPAEIRLLIWEQLFLPKHGRNPSRALKSTNSNGEDHKPWTVQIRTLEPEDRGPPSDWCRSTYLVRAARFRSRTMRTTYTLERPADSKDDIYPFVGCMSLLGACKQLHDEVSSLLYSNYIFDFGYSIEAIVPFLSDRTPLARSYIRHISFNKRAAPYTKHSDISEWAEAMGYLSSAESHLALENLTLNVQALHPGDDSWDLIPDIGADWFRAAKGIGIFGREGDEAEDGLGWASQLHNIRGLKSVKVNCVVERCFVPTSTGMVFWVGFSKSLEKGFNDWCWQEMVEREQVAAPKS